MEHGNISYLRSKIVLLFFLEKLEKMIWPRTTVGTLLIIALTGTFGIAEDRSASLRGHLSELVSQDRAPALFAAFVNREGVAFAAAAGVRRRGWSAEVTVKDLIRINSNTKAMTATMLATLVADGTFPRGWRTTIQDVFPELVTNLHKDYHTVTLLELVSMQSGVKKHAANLDSYTYSRIPDVVDRRYAILRDHFGEPPEGARGDFLYSNLSYMMAAAMAERLTRTTWKTLMGERLFKPLRMTSAGFGEPSRAAPDQPWGHYHDRDRTWVSVQRELPEVMGPAGTVHLTIDDWAKFIAVWFRGKAPAILDRRTFTDLITPETDNFRYAGGWYVRQKNGVTARIAHGGNSSSWRSGLRVYPRSGKAFLAVATGRDRDQPKTAEMLRSILRFMR